MATYARQKGDTNEVYYETLDYAFKKGEADKFRMSRRCDYDCCARIADMTERWSSDDEQTRRERQAKIIEEFGLERCGYIAAATVKGASRVDFPEDLSKWADKIRISDDRYVNATNVVLSKAEPMIDFAELVEALFAEAKRMRTNGVKEETDDESRWFLNDERIMSALRSYVEIEIESEKADKESESEDEKNAREDPASQKAESDENGSDAFEAKVEDETSSFDSDGKANGRDTAGEDARARSADEKEGEATVALSLPSSVVIRRYDESYFCRMPLFGEYSGYVFNMPAALVAASESGYTFMLPSTFKVRVRNSKDGKTLDLSQFLSALEGKGDADFKRFAAREDAVTINLPKNALVEERERSYLFALPDEGTFFVGKSLVEFSDGGFEIAMPPSFTVKTAGEEGTRTYSPAEIKKIADEADWENFAPPKSGVTGWRKMDVDKNALIYENEKRMLFRMPDGEYEKCSYYYPKSLVRDEGDRFSFSLPSDFKAELLESGSSAVIELDADALYFAVNGKGEDAYGEELVAPSRAEAKNRFKTESALRANVPKEMREKSNWVVVRTSRNAEKDKLDKYLISPVTGKFAESDNPDTWCDFETACRYARENGGDTLAYALDGDGVCCLDMDRCIDGDGILSAKATEAIGVAPEGTFREVSVSGNGVHIFGKIAKPLALRSFSRDNSCEFYRDCHFISMTGNGDGAGMELRSFDSPEMTDFLKTNFDKRKIYRNAGKGIEGVSVMSDRDVLDKAFAARGGDVMKRLFDGEDIRNNRSNSDMALMNRLAFWCNGDKEQMLRLFFASGLYRPEKSQDYYECTVMKALEWVPERYDVSPTKSPDGHGKGGDGRQK